MDKKNLSSERDSIPAVADAPPVASRSVVISARNVSKKYQLYDSPQHRLKEALHPFRRRYHREFWALRDISFEVRKGENMGIIGKNGCGKSTLLQIICSVLEPTAGQVHVNGKVSALLELGAGFNPQFTGRENVYLNGAIKGFTRKEMDEKFDAIASFADIGKFIDQPVKTYSSGMQIRLAFAAAISVEPDILIVDEALAVGDIFFQQKCHARMEELSRKGTTIIVVSHDMGSIEKYSSSVILLDHGRILFHGQPNTAVLRYQALAHGRYSMKDISAHHNETSELSLIEKGQGHDIADWPSEDSFVDISNAVSIGEEDVVRCTGLSLCNHKGMRSTVFNVGETALFFSEFEVLRDIGVPVGGIAIVNKQNILLHSKSSLHYLVPAPSTVRAGSRVRFRQEIVLNLAPGEYTFIGLLATIENEYYTRATEMHYSNLATHLHGLLRVSKVGSFLVKSDSFLPFAAYVDLPGRSSLELLDKKDEEDSRPSNP